MVTNFKKQNILSCVKVCPKFFQDGFDMFETLIMKDTSRSHLFYCY